LVFEGLIIAKWAGAAIGISALPTAELKGPTMETTALLLIRSVTFWTPLSALYAPPTASSRFSTVSVHPLTAPPAFCTAYFTPLRVGRPDEAAAPDSGRSTPIEMVPLLPPPPVLVPPPQATATIARDAMAATRRSRAVRMLLLLKMSRVLD